MIRFDTLAKPRITNRMVAWFWNTFFLSHARAAIIQMQDEELRIILKEGYDELKEIFEDTKLANEIKESRKLNESRKDGKMSMQDFVENINSDVLELIPDV